MATLEEQVSTLEASLVAMESKTLESQVERANAELLEGWQQLLKNLEEGVEASKKALEEKGLLPKPQDRQQPQELERT